MAGPIAPAAGPVSNGSRDPFQEVVMMRSNVKKLSVVLLAAVALALTGAAPARAEVQNRYGVVTITNATANVNITYYFKWGNGDWKKFVLQPGDTMHHSWQLAFVNQQFAPTPRIQFESGINGARGATAYRLKASASPVHNAFGTTYRFVRLLTFGGPDYLDLQ
jgi:hypothetical protein